MALDLFIAGKIGFMAMSGLVEDTLAKVSADTGLGKAAASLDDVMGMDLLARHRAIEVAADMMQKA